MVGINVGRLGSGSWGIPVSAASTMQLGADSPALPTLWPPTGMWLPPPVGRPSNPILSCGFLPSSEPSAVVSVGLLRSRKAQVCPAFCVRLDVCKPLSG